MNLIMMCTCMKNASQAELQKESTLNTTWIMQPKSRLRPPQCPQLLCTHQSQAQHPQRATGGQRACAAASWRSAMSDTRSCPLGTWWCLQPRDGMRNIRNIDKQAHSFLHAYKHANERAQIIRSLSTFTQSSFESLQNYHLTSIVHC